MSLLYADKQRPHADPQLQSAYNAMYDFQFGKTKQILSEYKSQHPRDPIGPLSDAALYMFQQFHRSHLLKSDFFAHNGNMLGHAPASPDAELEKEFLAALDKTNQLTKEELAHSQQNVDALLARVLSLTLQADYEALVKGNGGQALQDIKQATDDSNQLESVCPTCYDADLASGVENYILGQQSGVDRFFLSLDGAQTNEDKGLRKLKVVAAKGMYFRVYAKVLLAIADVRDHQQTKAAEIMSQLTKQYPDNEFFHEALQSVQGSSKQH